MRISSLTGWYFISSICLALIGLLALPLFTTHLGPEEFGRFFILSALSSGIASMACSVCVLSMSEKLTLFDSEDRLYYIGAVLVVGGSFSLVTCMVVFITFRVVSQAYGHELLDKTAIFLTFFAALFSSFWAICVQILNIEGRAKAFAITNIAQAVVNVIVVCIALFEFNELKNALLWGLFSSGCVGAIGAFVSLYNRFQIGNLRRWMPIAFRGGFASVLSSLMENGKNFVERSYLGATIGVYQLGLFAHGQYYKNSSMALVNAVSLGLVPISMSEAKELNPKFRITLQLWMPMQIILASICLVFALIGREVVGFLTNSKFVEATPYVLAMMLSLLFQTMAKPHSVLMLVRGKGSLYANINTGCIVFALVWLFASVPFIGVWGAISAYAIQVLLLRAALYWAANRIHYLPFTDQWVIVGFICSVMCISVDYLLELSFIFRVTALFLICLVFFLKFRTKFRYLLNELLLFVK